jgi:hypothetical protein
MVDIINFELKLQRETNTKVFSLNISNHSPIRFVVTNGELTGYFMDVEITPSAVDKVLRGICQQNKWRVPQTISLLGTITPKTSWSTEGR